MEELNRFINLAGEQWIETLNEILKKEGNIDDSDLYNAFLSIVSKTMSLLIVHDEATLLSIKDAFSVDLVYHDFIKYVESHSNAAFSIQPLRDLAKNDLAAAKKLLQDIINNDTVREGINFYENYSEYGLEQKEELARISAIVSTFAEFLVKNAFTEEAMLQNTRQNLYLGKELEKTLAELVNQNYREIQLRLIIKGINQH